MYVPAGMQVEALTLHHVMKTAAVVARQQYWGTVVQQLLDRAVVDCDRLLAAPIEGQMQNKS